jgi:hypothetical protein
VTKAPFLTPMDAKCHIRQKYPALSGDAIESICVLDYDELTHDVVVSGFHHFAVAACIKGRGAD